MNSKSVSYSTQNTVYPEQNLSARIQLLAQDVESQTNYYKQLLNQKDLIIANKDKEINFLRIMMTNIAQGKNIQDIAKHQENGNTKEYGSTDYRTIKVLTPYQYDVLWFKINATQGERDAFVDMLVLLFNTNLSLDEPLISSQAEVGYVFILLSKYSRYIQCGDIFQGSCGDLCKLINANVLPTIKDETRRKKLSCNEGTVNAAISDTKFKEENPRKWGDLYANDKTGQKKKLARAINIFERMKRK